MVDFRYHLVSLISVFLALAVGIVLGAGPLRDTISDQLTGQVEQLRSEKDALRVQLDETQGQLADDEAFLAATAPDLLAERLPSYRVALVLLPDVPQASVETVTERLGQAGASVTARVELTSLWADPSQTAVRSQVAGAVRDEVSAVAPVDTDADDAHVLAAALAVALTDADALDPSSPSQAAKDVLARLTGGSEPLATAPEAGTADLVLVLTPQAVQQPADATPDPEITAMSTGWGGALAPLGSYADAVVAGYATLPDDIVPAVRSAGGVSTVDGLDTLVGQLTVPLALAAVAAGEEDGDYGFGTGATSVAPPSVTLTAPVRGTSGGDGSGATDGATDGAADASTTEGAGEGAPEGSENADDAGTDQAATD
ncbi:MAG TPA: copper transporter, partial [Micrococcales bacterium]|nr:copper transporter [Micrococcales bacterium]